MTAISGEASAGANASGRPSEERPRVSSRRFGFAASLTTVWAALVMGLTFTGIERTWILWASSVLGMAGGTLILLFGQKWFPSLRAFEWLAWVLLYGALLMMCSLFAPAALVSLSNFCLVLIFFAFPGCLLALGWLQFREAQPPP